MNTTRQDYAEYWPAKCIPSSVQQHNWCEMSVRVHITYITITIAIAITIIIHDYSS